MSRVTTFTLTTMLLLFLGLALPASEAIAQQTGSTLHRYLVRAVLTAEGIKNLQKQPPTALKAGVVKFVESVGGKLEFFFLIMVRLRLTQLSSTPMKSLQQRHS